MGTRADFYVGRDEAAEWIGSIAYDGYPFYKPKFSESWLGGVKEEVLGATDEAAYRLAVADCLKIPSNHGTSPEQGWPWPWSTSYLTDYAYAFDDGQVWMSRFASEWKIPLYTKSTDNHTYAPDFGAEDYHQDDEDDVSSDDPRVIFPDMSSRYIRVPPGDSRSGFKFINFPIANGDHSIKGSSQR